MEKFISAIDKRWVVCILGSFIGCIALTLCLNFSSGSLSFQSIRSAEMSLSLPSGQLNMTTLASPFPASPLNSSVPDLVEDRQAEPSSLTEIKGTTQLDATTILRDPQLTSKLSFEELSADTMKEQSSSTTMSDVEYHQLGNFSVKELPVEMKKGQSTSSVVRGFRNHPNQTNLKLSRSTDSTAAGLNSQNIVEQSCNIFEGDWVYDDKKKVSPLYHGSQCPFLSDQVSCQRNGRSDSDYEKWSWEAKGCHIPRFNGTDMLERLGGKRVVIVGDSLNRNQWESLACLLYSSVPALRAHVEYKSNVYKVFRAMDYNFSAEFYWSPFLIQLDVNPDTGKRILRLDELLSTARQWKGADIMVFNTGHWWVHSGKSRAWDSFEHKGKIVESMATVSALEIAMRTWARWIDNNVDFDKTTVYFRSISPEHKGAQWCYNQTQPIRNESFTYEFPKPVLEVIARTLEKMKTPVRYLNITTLSEYRKDAHPSIYARKQGKVLMKKNENVVPEYKGDCSHWCLPGVPDTWNRLIYAGMVMQTKFNSSSGSSL